MLPLLHAYTTDVLACSRIDQLPSAPHFDDAQARARFLLAFAPHSILLRARLPCVASAACPHEHLRFQVKPCSRARFQVKPCSRARFQVKPCAFRVDCWSMRTQCPRNLESEEFSSESIFQVEHVISECRLLAELSHPFIAKLQR
eukprot:3811496-Pleurochrysis_carterae.AAC.1